MLFQNGASICPAYCLLWLNCLECALHVSLTFSLSLCLAFSVSFICPDYISESVTALRGSFLQQFNFMSDVRIFRRGQLMHISCINHLAVVEIHSDPEKVAIHNIKIHWFAKWFCPKQQVAVVPYILHKQFEVWLAWHFNWQPGEAANQTANPTINAQLLYHKSALRTFHPFWFKSWGSKVDLDLGHGNWENNLTTGSL